MDLAEEANVDEAITAEAKASNEMENNIKEYRNTKSYKETMNIDIENINTIEKRNKLYAKIMEDYLQSYTTISFKGN